jgi:hypothetical protein
VQDWRDVTQAAHVKPLGLLEFGYRGQVQAIGRQAFGVLRGYDRVNTHFQSERQGMYRRFWERCLIFVMSGIPLKRLEKAFYLGKRTKASWRDPGCNGTKPWVVR